MTDKPAPVEQVETWSEIQHSPAKIVACGERWKGVARIIGCELYGFDDGRSASFTTPDGNVIEVGSKFRAAIEARQPPAARVAELEAENARLREALETALDTLEMEGVCGVECWSCAETRALLGDKP